MSFFRNNDGMGATMLVNPAGYGGGLGADMGGAWWLILLVLLMGGGLWGGMGGLGMMGGLGGMWNGMGLYPWMNQAEITTQGFANQANGFAISDLRNAVSSGFGDVQLGIAGVNQNICQTGNTITGALRDGFSAAEIAANGRQMANMQQMFGVQSAIQAGDSAMTAGLADVKYTVAQQGCDDRAALAQGLQAQTMQEMSNTNALMSALRDGIQSIKDELCADRLEAERRDNANLRSELMYARGQASQVAQTAQIVDDTYNRLRNCPVNAVPVFGNQPIFTCPTNVNNGCGCGNAGLGFAA